MQNSVNEFLTPRVIKVDEKSTTRALVTLEPLERGFGHTLGNALRRILLSSMPGCAVTEVEIDGVLHEYSAIEGVQEDVIEILLNLKGVALVMNGKDEAELTLSASGAGVVTAGDIQVDHDIEIRNPEHVICTVTGDQPLMIRVVAQRGRGYSPADSRMDSDDETRSIGRLQLDASFSPIRRVSYVVDSARVEQRTDYEKLVLHLECDGSISPKDALQESAKILIQHFMLFSDERISLELEERVEVEEFDETSLHMRQLLKTKLSDMDLSVRALNCLKAADIESLGELVSYNKNDLLKFRNFGKKSLTELEDLVENKNLSFGMDVSKYKLDKE